ncbi:hypothetical protein Tco_0998294, partial [Tanacetum coccineum]
MIDKGKWRWPISLTDEFDGLNVIAPPVVNQGKNDKVVWNDIRERNHVVHWAKLVWFSQGIPRHSFMVWLAIHK